MWTRCFWGCGRGRGEVCCTCCRIRRSDILFDENPEALDILDDVLRYLEAESPNGIPPRGAVYGFETAYTRFMGIGGTTLRDSFHLGQTIDNDYGRPYQSGFNNIAGFSTLNEYGRFSLYLRGEYQHAPGGPGYSQALASQLSNIDGIPYGPPNYPQATIPSGPIAAQNPFRLVERRRSPFICWGHEISGGKSDAWLGPAQGSSMAWSNNAENIYSFRINRVEPLYIPFLSRAAGADAVRLFLWQPEGPYLSEFAVHPLGDVFLSTHLELRVRVSTDDHLWRRGPCACDSAHVPEGIFLSDRYDGSGEKLRATIRVRGYSDFNLSYRLPYLRKYLTVLLRFDRP